MVTSQNEGVFMSQNFATLNLDMHCLSTEFAHDLFFMHGYTCTEMDTLGSEEMRDCLVP